MHHIYGICTVKERQTGRQGAKGKRTAKETGKQYETAEAYGLDLKQVAGKCPILKFFQKKGRLLHSKNL